VANCCQTAFCAKSEIDLIAHMFLFVLQ